MSNIERRFFRAWLVLLALSALLFLVPWLLALLIITIIGAVVAFPLLFVPTAALYLSAILAIYWPARLLFGRSARVRSGIAAASTAVVALAGVIIPFELNASLKSQAHALVADDIGTKPLLSQQASIALVSDVYGDEQRCDSACQRPLYKGLTRRMLIMPPQGFEAAKEGKPFDVGVHERVRHDDGCGKVRLGPDYLTSAEWRPAPNPPRIWDYQDILADSGECLRSSRGRDPRASAYLVDIWNFKQLAGSRGFGWLPEPAWRRQEVVLRTSSQWRRLYRRTQVQVRLLRVPLVINPPFSFDTYSPGGLATNENYQLGKEPALDGMLGPLIRNDLRLPDLVERERALNGSH